MYSKVYYSPIGPLYIAEAGEAITRLAFSPGGVSGKTMDTPLLRECKRQLTAYFEGTLHRFDLPLAPQGTLFQMKVWHTLSKIPYGTTWSYKDLALAVGSPKGYRAVGQANNRNPIAIILPCHRVIGSDNSLTGYGGGLAIKARLLGLEGVL